MLESTRWVFGGSFCSEIRGEQSRFCEFLDGLHYANLEHLNSPMHLSSEMKCSTWITLYAWHYPLHAAHGRSIAVIIAWTYKRRLGIFRKSNSPQAISPHSPFRIKDQGNASAFVDGQTYFLLIDVEWSRYRRQRHFATMRHFGLWFFFPIFCV